MHALQLALSPDDLSSPGQMPLPRSLVGLSVPDPSSLNLVLPKVPTGISPSPPPIPAPVSSFLPLPFSGPSDRLPGPSEAISSLWGPLYHVASTLSSEHSSFLPSSFSQKPIQDREPRLNKSLVEQPL